MSGVIQSASGVGSASFPKLPSQENGILAAVTATAGVDLSRGLSLSDNQGNMLGEAALFEMWDMVVGHQALEISFYGLLRLPAAAKGTYTVTVNGLPSGSTGGAAAVTLFEVNGLQSLDQTGTNGSTGNQGAVATGTACAAINSNPNALVIAALAVPDNVWANPPRYPPSGYTGVYSDVISPKNGALFSAVQTAYKVVHAVETSSADWGTIAVGGGFAWPWVSAVASFGLASSPRTGLSVPSAGLAALAPLAWIIARRRKRARERAR